MGVEIRFLLWQLIVYSFLGWVIVTAITALKKKKFVDVGFLYGPYCPSYGFGAILFTIVLSELKDSPFFLFVGGALLGAMIVYCEGFVLHRISRKKWWDYSDRKYQFASYVHVPSMLVWGLCAWGLLYVMNPLLNQCLLWIPGWIENIILWIVFSIMMIDLLGTLTGILAIKKQEKRGIVHEVSENMYHQSQTWGEHIASWTLNHFEKSYPTLKESIKEDKKVHHCFGEGCSFYKIVSLFFIGSFLGDIIETTFVYLTTGNLMSRSSVLFGQFSIVWGLGCAFLTLVLYQYRERSDRFIFLFGTILGGAYEYMCSVFTELVFGTVFWDYSHLPFQLGGRINLLFCFFWGIVAVVWMKMIYPFLSRYIEMIPMKKGKIVTWCLIVFMVFNIFITSIALSRYSQRQQHQQPTYAIEKVIDHLFPDDYIEHRYQNMKLK